MQRVESEKNVELKLVKLGVNGIAVAITGGGKGGRGEWEGEGHFSE